MRKIYSLLIIFLSIILFSFANESFVEQQKKYPRFRKALTDKYNIVRSCFEDRNINFPPNEIFIRVFKQEKIIELWAKSSEIDTFSLIKLFTFCSSSGTLGPKRMQGDLQIPEGFYYIDRFNPYSNFYLSLGINYPNASDRIFGSKGKLGGDIFIHGDCVTIGCIPITDDLIKELYIIAVYAKNHGQKKIPVYIFPTYLNSNNIKKMNQKYSKNKIVFWQNLQEGYLYFERNHKLPKISVNVKTGRYIFNKQ